MHIDSIEIYQVGLPLRQPLSTPLGPRSDWRPCWSNYTAMGRRAGARLVRGPAPLAGGEWAAGVFALLRDWLGPAIVGQSFSSGEELSQRLAAFRGNPWAKSALDTAWWDLHARLQDQPLHQLLGGKQEAIEVGPTFDRREFDRRIPGRDRRRPSPRASTG